jgi:sulfur-carrier protein
MPLTIKLFATFQKGRFDVARRECPPGTTLAAIVDELGIPREEIGVLLVGGRHAELEHVPGPDDTVSIFPLLGGG